MAKDKAKYKVGYCDTCGRETKHVVLECTERLGWRIFENLLTLGAIGAAFGYDYKCECTKCGTINTIRK